MPMGGPPAQDETRKSTWPWRSKLSRTAGICGCGRWRQSRSTEEPRTRNGSSMSSRKSLRPADRVTALKLRQTLKMARSAHAYVRGSTVQFYEWLEQQKRGTLPEGRAVWIFWDCHAGNLGPVASLA